MNAIPVSPARLEHFVRHVYTRAGLPEGDAGLLANSLGQACVMESAAR